MMVQKTEHRRYLENIFEKYPDQVSWYQGRKHRSNKKFFDLIEKSDEKADYYAFSDQDDYWHKEN